jgi:hypothetical protein
MLELMKAYAEEMLAGQQEMADLRAEIQRRAQEVQSARMSNMYTLWSRMALSVGLDPATTWSDGRYGIESRFINDGYAALTFMPKLDELLGGINPLSDEEKAQDTPVVDLSKLN